MCNDILCNTVICPGLSELGVLGLLLIYFWFFYDLAIYPCMWVIHLNIEVKIGDTANISKLSASENAPKNLENMSHYVSIF